MKCVHVFVSGRVQGVSYRRFARENAIRLGLKGWVQNLDDGRVEVFASGEGWHVDKFVDILRKGPVLSRVDTVDVRVISENEMDRDFVGFDIRR